MVERRNAKAHETQHFDETAFRPIDHTEIRWMAGAGFMINSRGIVIMVDPHLITIKDDPLTSEEGLEMVVDYPIKAANVPKIDAIFYTHSDADHLGLLTAQVLQKLNPLMIGPPPVFEKLVRSGFLPDHLQVCRYGDKIAIGPISIEVTKADHPWQLLNPVLYGKPFRSGDACGYKIITADGTVLAPGDTRLMEEHLEIKGIDVLFLDVTRDAYHLNVHGAIILANCMSEAFLIPYHYGTYNAPDSTAFSGDPEEVFCHVTDREKRERILAPGQPFCLCSGKEL